MRQNAKRIVKYFSGVTPRTPLRIRMLTSVNPKLAPTLKSLASLLILQLCNFFADKVAKIRSAIDQRLEGKQPDPTRADKLFIRKKTTFWT